MKRILNLLNKHDGLVSELRDLLSKMATFQLALAELHCGRSSWKRSPRKFGLRRIASTGATTAVATWAEASAQQAKY